MYSGLHVCQKASFQCLPGPQGCCQAPLPGLPMSLSERGHRYGGNCRSLQPPAPRGPPEPVPGSGCGRRSRGWSLTSAASTVKLSRPLFLGRDGQGVHSSRKRGALARPARQRDPKGYTKGARVVPCPTCKAHLPDPPLSRDPASRWNQVLSRPLWQKQGWKQLKATRPRLVHVLLQKV